MPNENYFCSEDQRYAALRSHLPSSGRQVTLGKPTTESFGKKHADRNSLCRADASIAGQATGAMSFAFISALKKNPQQSYVQLLNSIREELAGKYDQKP